MAIATSEFTLLEALVGAFREEDEALAATYRAIREDAAFQVVPVGVDVIEKPLGFERNTLGCAFPTPSTSQPPT